MKRIISYLFTLIFIVALVYAGLAKGDVFPEWVMKKNLIIRCGLIGVLGGTLYCIRGVYLNKCVRNCWDDRWHVWYVLRPIVSGIGGVVAYLILKAGLIVLDASKNGSGGDYGYMAFAFFAGLNVDKFIGKIEDVGMAIFGIEKSRSANPGNSPDKT
ncbi:hypothetical protein NB716_000363 [Pantoea ananatis]|uniref:hypothetical protein n=1 Tax=Pantoea ananas TaxID=553 RepID=UPI0021F7A984|nr:hypothetical protein [Pantoea ananatis]MCW0351569.1 hypothetical protein [Pantoea ananatis]